MESDDEAVGGEGSIGAVGDEAPNPETDRLLRLGAWSFVVSSLCGIVGLFLGQAAGPYVDAAMVITWIPGVRALLFLGESLDSRGLARATIGMFWATALLLVIGRSAMAGDDGQRTLITVIGWVALAGVVFFMFRQPARDETAESRTKVFAVVGVGLLVLGKVLVKIKFWHFFGLSRLTRGVAKHGTLEIFESGLMLLVGVLMFGSMIGLGVALVRRGDVHRMFRTAGVFTFLATIAMVAATVVTIANSFEPDADPTPEQQLLEDLAWNVPGFVWACVMAAMLLSVRRLAMPGRVEMPMAE